jgi:hypothetical protein
MAWCEKRLFFFLWLSLALLPLFCLDCLPSCSPFLISTCGLSSLTDDPSATQVNPVGGEGGLATSTSYLFSMGQLNQIDVATVVNYQNNSMYAAWQSLSNDDYTRQDIRIGVRYSYRFFRLGLGYKMLYDQISDANSANDDRLDAGLRLKYKNSTLDLGSEHELPISGENNFSAGDFTLSAGQKIDANLTLAAGLSAVHEEPWNYKLGCLFQLNPNLKAIASWESEPGHFGMGAVFNLKWFNLAYAVQTHSELDWTHSVGISALFP